MQMHANKHKLNLKGKLFFAAGSVLALVLLLAALSFLIKGNIELTLNGEKEMLLSYGQDHYTEAGASAVYKGFLFNSNVSVPVSIDGQPEYYAVPGEYVVRYTASFHGRSSVTKTRSVIIRDVTPPEIILLSNPDQITEAGEPYEEEGYHAFDQYDGDLTAKVVRRMGDDGCMYYSVTDSSGNTAEKKREIRYHDTQAPTIVLKGAADIFMHVGEVFEDPGAEANDNAEGNISDKIQVDGSVDTAREGVYKLRYSVSDRSGNTANAERTVTVWPVSSITPQPGSENGNVIYLTFDDGPGPYTADLLDLLKKYHIKVTFFVTNQKPGYHDMIAREAAEGHSVGIHSASHNYDIYASEDAFFADLNTMRDIIIEQTGKAPDIVRFIGGSSTTKANYNPGIISRLAAMLEQKGYAYFDWNVSTGDGNFSIATEDAYNFAIDGISKHSNSVVLMHDLNKNSMAAVEEIIIWGLKNGYTFLPLTHDSPVCHHRISN